MIGDEISFTRSCYRPQSLRTLKESCADILALEQETEGLLPHILRGYAALLNRSRAGSTQACPLKLSCCLSLSMLS